MFSERFYEGGFKIKLKDIADILINHSSVTELTPNKTLISNNSGKVSESNVTSDELGHLVGTENNIQEQLNKKATIEQGKKADTALQATSDISNTTANFTQASTRENLTTGEKISVSLGKIMKWFSDLKTVAFSGSYSDLSNKPTSLKNPTSLTLQMNGGSSQSYDGSSAKTFNVTPAGINSFAKTDVIPIANGGTGVTRVLDIYTQLKLVPITIVRTTDSNGQVRLATEWWPGQHLLYVVATLSGGFGTSVRVENPENNAFVFTCFSGTNRLTNTAVRLNFIFGTGWNNWG